MPNVHRHLDVLATREDVDAAVLHAHDQVHAALSLLDDAESVAEAPLVDEAERVRLEELHDGTTPRGTHWHSVLAVRGTEAVGYAGVILPDEAGGLANGDVAMLRESADCSPVLAALMASVEALAWRHEAGRSRLWVRQSQPIDASCAADNGYVVDRRLAVLGRSLEPVPDRVEPPAGMTVRPVTEADLDEVVRVLAAAYEGTPDGGWDRDRLDEKRRLDWYDDADLLVAVADDGTVGGLHWTKRRGEGVGEVYNLAVDPAAQGSGLGRVLLTAGLRHLAQAGQHEVLLWVDEDNERAVRLYAANGFRSRWVDVAFARALRGPAA